MMSDAGQAGGSTETVVEKVHTGKVVVLSLIAALGGFLFGYDSSVINGANKAVFYEFAISDGFMQGFVVDICVAFFIDNGEIIDGFIRFFFNTFLNRGIFNNGFFHNGFCCCFCRGDGSGASRDGYE